jgi:hypothetical protein
MHRSSRSCLFKAHAVFCDTSMVLFSGILQNRDSISVIKISPQILLRKVTTSWTSCIGMYLTITLWCIVTVTNND